MKHGHGNDGPATPASVAYRGAAPFDHRHGGKGAMTAIIIRSRSSSSLDSPASAPDPQDGLVAVIGGSAIAAGDASAVSGFVENVAIDKGAISIAMGEAIFQASAQSASPHGAAAAADTFLDVSGADFIIEREVGGSKHGAHAASAYSELDYLAIDIMAGRRLMVRSSSSSAGRPATISRLATIRSRASSRRWLQWPRRMAPTPCRPRSPAR